MNTFTTISMEFGYLVKPRPPKAPTFIIERLGCGYVLSDFSGVEMTSDKRIALRFHEAEADLWIAKRPGFRKIATGHCRF